MILKYRSIVFLALFMSLIGMSTVYLGEFRQGAIQGGAEWRLLSKLIALGLFLAALAKDKLYFNSTMVWVTGIHAFIFLTTLLVASMTGQFPRDLQWVNFHIGVLSLWASYNWYILRHGEPDVFRSTLMMALLVSAGLDAWAVTTGSALWENNALIGTLGNPSTFGFLCTMGILYCSTLRQPWRLLVTIALMLLAVGTQSLFAIASASMALAFVNRSLAFIFWPITIAVSIQLIVLVQDMHFFFKLMSVGDLLASGGGESASIYTRVEFYQYLMSLLKEYPIALLVGHPGGISYVVGDAGWFSLIVSYGLPVVIFYLIVLVRGVWPGRKKLDADRLATFLSVLLFLGFMIVNRIHDYWPVSLLFYWQVGHLLAYREER